ncbi:beta-ketoacyl synthase N-terminal-like domain-containing protein [Streptomyces sp. NPDC005438]|uniref:beta-ketoacyl synthase N-terminal-like domain-containing protein n=1 Tax=Streptomyces sp. NPDC005438 TaxID=3156880 RepID=UPI0033BEF7D9
MSSALKEGVGRPVFTAWSSVSPYGIGRAAHVAGVAERRSTLSPSGAESEGQLNEQACLVPDFDVRKVLGKKGTRTMDRSMGLAVTTVRRLLEEAEAEGKPIPVGTGTALVLGTSFGSARSQGDFIRSSFVEDAPYDVPAQHMPNVLMNGPTASTAIWADLKGPNTTVAGGRPSGHLALSYARRLLAAGRAERALVGAVEEYSTTRAWFEYHSQGEEEKSPSLLGEGCAVLLLEPAESVPQDRTVLAELLAVDVRTDVYDDLAGTLDACVEEVLRQSEINPEDVWAASTGGVPGTPGEVEREVVTRRFGTVATDRVLVHELLGDLSGASVPFQLTTLLAAAEADEESFGRPALITSVDRDGVVACAAVRLLNKKKETP